MSVSVSAKEAAFKELLQWTLDEPQHRYEFLDGNNEVTFRFYTSNEAVAQATALRTLGFQCRCAGGVVGQIRFVDGVWMHLGGSTLFTVQQLLDHEALFHILLRLEMRAEIQDLQQAEVDEMMAMADAFAFRRIQLPAAQKSAAHVIAVIARGSHAYRAALDRALPGFGLAAKVQDLSGVALATDGMPFSF